MLDTEHQIIYFHDIFFLPDFKVGMYLFELVDIYIEDVHTIKKVFLHSILARPEKVSTVI